ncbi:MAG: hypothetical protein JXA03_13230, partial [Bacteroidales bacterium]|nr:hypothetical protein [Bacteroidales bacterium]
MNHITHLHRIFLFLVSLFIILNNPILAQESDADWWNRTQEWDGVTHWSKYIITSPYYLGPNALPVPENQKGSTDSIITFEAGYFNHFFSGDLTQNARFRLYVPIAGGKAGLELVDVPFEFYDMDTATVIERRGRHQNGSGVAAGDIHISTFFRIIRNHRAPDLVLGIHIKTASGNKLSDARHTDFPGYWFDLSAGKDLGLGANRHSSLRLFATTGFFVWQTNLDNNPQDDAFLFGAGADARLGKVTISGSLDGYLGYFGNRRMVSGNVQRPVEYKDRPVVIRSSVSY